jgi:anti-sigma factor RsiW
VSPELRRRVPDPVHEKARLLAAEAVDGELSSTDATWLDGHLSGCPDCAAAAIDFAAIHDELRSLTYPEPPRDLWARTAASLDAVDGRPATRRSKASAREWAGMRPMIGTLVAVTAAVVVVGASLLSQSLGTVSPGSTRTSGIAFASATIPPASGAPGAQLAFVKGTSYWIASADGVYQIMGGTTSCTAGSGSCTVAGGSGAALGSIASGSEVSAVLAPDAGLAAVWTADKIAIVTLSTTPQTVALDMLTPRPTAAATATPTATPTATATAAPTVLATNAATPVASVAPSATPAETATAAVTPAATARAAASATAILDGYEIVGRDPEFSADGTIVAFSARPVDRSTGPDVFVWRVGDERAHAVSARHSDVFYGWSGSRILVGEFAPGSDGSAAVVATSYIYNPVSGEVWRVERPMIVAGIDPAGIYVIYWAGAVEFDSATGQWRPGKGALYYDRLANLGLTTASMAASPTAPAPTVVTSSTPAVSSEEPTAAGTEAPAGATDGAIASIEATAVPTSESAPSVVPAPVQVPGTGTVRSWVIRWDDTGRDVAVWVADGASEIGKLRLYEMAAGELVPRLTVEAVLASVAFDGRNLVYTAADGRIWMKPIPATQTPAPTTVPTEPAPTQFASATVEPATIPAGTPAVPGA